MYATYYLTLVLLYIINICAHSFGFYVLISQKQTESRSIQHMFVINLSCVEILTNLLRILPVPLKNFLPISEGYKEVRRYGFIIMYTGINILYYSSMLYITINRLLEVKLNIKYNLYCTKSRVKYLIVITWILCIIESISFALADYIDPYSALILINSVFDYVYRCLDIIYIILVASTYIFIFQKFRETRRLPSKYGTQVQDVKESGSVFKVFTNSRFYVYCLLTLNFTLLVIMPNLINTFVNGFQYSDVSPVVSMAQDVLVPISDFGDAFIYIMLDKTLKKPFQGQ